MYKTQKEKIYANKDTIVNLYSIEGRNKSYISRALNVDRKTLSNIINYEWKLEKADVQHLKEDNEAFYKKHKVVISKKLKEGVTVSSIAKYLNVSENYLRSIIRYDTELQDRVKKNVAVRNSIKHQNKQNQIEELIQQSSLNYNFPDLPGEIWKKVSYNPEKYMVSNMGRVKSYKKTYGRYILMKPVFNKKLNYEYISIVGLSGKPKTFRLHRLVAEHFCLQEDKTKNTVNHIDGDTRNNKASNLEWVTQSENNKHSYDFLNRGNTSLNQYNNPVCKYIYKDQYEFKTVKDLSIHLKKSETQTRRYLKNPEKYGIKIIYKNS